MICIYNLVEAIDVTSGGSTAIPCIGNVEIPGLMFADDILLFSITPAGLSKQLQVLETYCKRWKLKINVNKTKILICKNGFRKSRHENWVIGGEIIETVNKLQYLGFLISGKGDSKEHIERAKMKGLRGLASTKILVQKLPEAALTLHRNVYNALCLTKMLYGAEIWGTAKEISKLEPVECKYIKTLMCLPTCVANCGVKQLLQEVCVRAEAGKRVINYWSKLRSGKGGEMVQIIFKQQCADETSKSWVNEVKCWLRELGLGYLLSNQALCGKKVVKRCVQILNFKILEVDVKKSEH